MGCKKPCCGKPCCGKLASRESGEDIEKTVLASDYSVEEKYKIAQYETKIVAEVESRPSLSPKKMLWNLKYFRLNIFGQTWGYIVGYLVCYYIVQIIFQTGKRNPICVTAGNYSMSPIYKQAIYDQVMGAYEYEQYKKEAATQRPSPPPLPEITPEFQTPEDFCQLQSMMKFQLWGAYEALMTRYLTFFLGFYVGHLIKRWWDQISKLTDAGQVASALGGLVWPKPDDKRSEKQALDLKKTILRYCMLSWTMCLSEISCPLRQKFKTGEEYINKGLIKEEELRMLKVGGGSAEGWMDQWWIPLTWATHLTNDAFNRTGLIPKDAKDLRGVLGRFQDKLEDLTKYTHNPLPEVYKQAVTVAVFGWMFMGVLGGQGASIYDPKGIIGPSSLVLTLIYNFPFHMVLKYILIIGWLKTAEIVRNPFGSDKYYDVILENELDFNIWKASVTLQNQKMVSR